MTQIAGARGHSLAIRNDGSLWTWGYNAFGELGDGTTTTRSTPVRVPSLSGVTQVAGGRDHSLALRSDRTVWAFGHST